MKRFGISIWMALLVLSLGFDVDIAWAQSEKDLNQASVDGDLERVKTLVGQGADVNAMNRMKMTPLLVAAMNNRTEVCKFLADKGATLDTKSGMGGQTALYYAVEKNNKDLAEFLVKKGADVNIATTRGENPFSLAKKMGNTEMADFLAKNGAKDPVVVSAYGDEYYGEEMMQPGGRGATPRAAATRGVPQATGEVDLLADPNEIQARIKTIPGLEKEILVLATKSKTEMRYWGESRRDNRTMLARAVQKQLDDEWALVRKSAVEEKASKTIEAIDKMLAKKKDRDSEVRKALLEQRREAAAGGDPTMMRSGGRSRGSTRSSGRGGRGYSTGGTGRSSGYGTSRSSRGYATGGGAAGGAYGGYEDMAMNGGGRPGGAGGRPQEQLDPDTEEEIRHWEGATPDKKLELAKALHPLNHGDFAYIRTIAVEEEAKKTTTTIDGILLARQVRFDVYVKAAELLKSTAAGQPGTVDQYGNPIQQGVRSGRGRTRGNVGTQQQQQMQGRRRGRR